MMDTMAEVIAVLGVVACIALIVVFWQSLSAIIPTHFNIAGQVNGYGPKTELLKPMGLGLILYLALTAVVVFRHQLNAIFRVTDKLPDSKYVILRGMLSWFKAEIVWSCALMEAVLINAGMQYHYSLALILPLPVIVIILTFLYYAAKLVRPGQIKL